MYVCEKTLYLHIFYLEKLLSTKDLFAIFFLIFALTVHKCQCYLFSQDAPAAVSLKNSLSKL